MKRSSQKPIFILLATLLLGFSAWLLFNGLDSTSPRSTPTFSPNANDPHSYNLLAVGDISECPKPGAAITAAMLKDLPGPILLLGDIINDPHTDFQYRTCFLPLWGDHMERFHPVPGNHDYDQPDAKRYFKTFGLAAGEPGQGYYSFEIGSWHVIALNSNCAEIGGCGPGSAQYAWLENDLATHTNTCTLAYWHHPLFSSSQKGGAEELRPTWQLLYDANADLVLNGHDHLYERFAPQTPNGQPDPLRGMRQFIVGTGGSELGGVRRDPPPTGELQIMGVFGFLQLTLHPNSYDWQFIPQPGATQTDQGSQTCH